jgi:CHAT domain-containing protein
MMENNFTIEKYSLGSVPSIGLTGFRATSLGNAEVLAMGASKFKTEADLDGNYQAS